MAPLLLYCMQCDAGYASMGEVPPVCPRCNQQTQWTMTPPLVFTVSDRRFLKAIRIAADIADYKRDASTS